MWDGWQHLRDGTQSLLKVALLDPLNLLCLHIKCCILRDVHQKLNRFHKMAPSCRTKAKLQFADVSILNDLLTELMKAKESGTTVQIK